MPLQQEQQDKEEYQTTGELARETLSIIEDMVLHNTKNPRDSGFLRTQFSRIEWESVRDLKNSFKNSFKSGNGMAAAAAAAASSLGEGLDGSASDRYGPGSRYDPSTLNRIGADLTDLHEEASDISNVSDLGGSKTRTRILAATSGILVAACIGIFLFAPSNIPYAGWSNSNNSGRGPNAHLQVGYELPDQQQRLLDIAKHVLSACSEKQLDEDMSDCQSVCSGKLCCFENIGSEYDCREDEEVKCPVYTGCEALVEGVPSDAAATSTERRVRWG